MNKIYLLFILVLFILVFKRIYFPFPTVYDCIFSLPLIKTTARVDRLQMHRNWQRLRIEIQQSSHIHWPQFDHRAFLEVRSVALITGSTDYWSFVIWAAQIRKDLTSLQQPLSSVPQGGHCGEIQLYLKIPSKSEIIMYAYMWLCSIFNFLFSFSDRRETKEGCFEQGWGRSSDVQKWLQQLRSSLSEGHAWNRLQERDQKLPGWFVNLYW